MPPKNAPDTRRDNFTAQVVKILAERSGGKCAICRAPTWGPNDCLYKSTNIGQAAHITAAAPNGPRYDPKMSSERRSSALNGMWLCGNCHQKIDKDVAEYPVKRLQELKKKAEEDAKEELGVAAVQTSRSRDDSPITIATSASAIMEIRKVKSALQDLTYSQECSEATDFLEKLKYISIVDNSYLPAVGTELLQFYWLLVTYDSKQTTWLQVIRLLEEISKVYHTAMTQDDVNKMCTIATYMITNKTHNSKMQYQSAISFLSALARKLKEERSDITNTAQDELNAVTASTRPKRGAKRRGGKDTTDGDVSGGKDTTDGDVSSDDSDGNEAYKYLAIEESHDFSEWTYLSTMSGLVDLGDEERRQKEASLEDEGYITYVI